ncbi:hypothetical protein N7462_005182 [Penicillium macrosclerotiorum]|uniref:uncharacterized protein n=1 Tax=Penicillium macrosclerotiorum TaxID=303699 RepID=UPI00254767B0|nr:uncharacterized protein N7462_005182 [Penicillium macrosclerotiorum]KAJ5690790.1 hypothetical protein N7462_005182 [Penicillium macrosclerotiorum]
MGGPYAPQIAQLGGRPTVDVDVPICSIFLALFLACGICHMTIFRRNLARGHKFIPSAVTFGFCMSRVVANVMRITWACYPNNIRVALASQIFVAAGVLLLFILNLLYAQRMLRAAFQTFGWSRGVSWAFKVLYILVLLTIIMIITVVIQSMYTLNANTHRIDRDIQLYGVTYFAIVSFLPLPIVALMLLFVQEKHVAPFGSGSWRSKALIVLTAGTLLCLGASFRAGTTWMAPRPITDPPRYMHKACFYVFDFGIDILVVIIFLFGRVDKRFHVPNGSSKVRHYRGEQDIQKNQLHDQTQGLDTNQAPQDVENSSTEGIPYASRQDEKIST